MCLYSHLYFILVVGVVVVVICLLLVPHYNFQLWKYKFDFSWLLFHRLRLRHRHKMYQLLYSWYSRWQNSITELSHRRWLILLAALPHSAKFMFCNFVYFFFLIILLWALWALDVPVFQCTCTSFEYVSANGIDMIIILLYLNGILFIKQNLTFLLQCVCGGDAYKLVGLLEYWVFPSRRMTIPAEPLQPIYIPGQWQIKMCVLIVSTLYRLNRSP